MEGSHLGCGVARHVSTLPSSWFEEQLVPCGTSLLWMDVLVTWDAALFLRAACVSCGFFMAWDVALFRSFFALSCVARDVTLLNVLFSVPLQLGMCAS